MFCNLTRLKHNIPLGWRPALSFVISTEFRWQIRNFWKFSSPPLYTEQISTSYVRTGKNLWGACILPPLSSHNIANYVNSCIRWDERSCMRHSGLNTRVYIQYIPLTLEQTYRVMYDSIHNSEFTISLCLPGIQMSICQTKFNIDRDRDIKFLSLFSVSQELLLASSIPKSLTNSVPCELQSYHWL